MSEYIITIEQIKDLIAQSAAEAIDGYKLGVAKQIWSFPKLPKIVRRRDCRHHKDRNGAILPSLVCQRLGYHNFKVEPDGFCKWASRKEVDE